MIGTKIRGFHHFNRMVKALQEATFFFKHDGISVGGGVAVYMDGSKYNDPFIHANGDYIILFNDCFNNCKPEHISYLNKTDIFGRLNELFNRYYHIWVVPINKRNFHEDYGYFNDLIIAPKDFDKMYSDFCDANKKQMPNVTKYSNADCSLYKYIFAISNGSKNFYFWAINAYFKNKISIYQIERILKWNDKYSQLQSKLKKGTITAYTNAYDFFNIVGEMAALRREKRANDVINMFNTAQKKLLKNAKLSDRDYETLSKFGKLSSKKKNNFVRKMSTIEDPVEILRQMSFLADIHFEWSKESFLDYYKNLENFNCEIVLEKGDIVLLKVKDYEAVKRLAKSTNWCISKDKKYWNEYVEMRRNATQYVLFDFSKKEDDNLSIVGFTSVHDRGITHAHDFQNHNIMGSKCSNTVSEIKSFVSKYIDCSNIYGVLDKYGISLSDVVSYEPTHYKWNRDDMFDYLNRCVDPEDYYIIADYGNKLALMVENDDVKYFLGDAYIDNRNYGHQQGDTHIIFADFNKKENDPEKIVFGVIHHNFSTHESTCNRLFNERFEKLSQSFDSKLEEYGLPYDTICRTDNVIDRFYNAFLGYELSTVRDLLKDSTVINDLKRLKKTGELREAIINVTFNMVSSDYLDAIYNSGLTLFEIIGEGYTADFGRRLVNVLCDNRANPDVPSSGEIEAFQKNEINQYPRALYIGYFLMLMKFIDYEKKPSSFINVVVSIVEHNKRSDLFDLVMSRICEKVDFTGNNMLCKYITNYAFSNNSASVINVLSQKKLSGNNAIYFANFAKKYTAKSTEIWVKQNETTYVLTGMNEEAVAHAPRRR